MKTTEQANIVGDAAVVGANEISQKTVEGVENVAMSTGLVNPVSFEAVQGSHSAYLTHQIPAVSVTICHLINCYKVQGQHWGMWCDCRFVANLKKQ